MSNITLLQPYSHIQFTTFSDGSETCIVEPVSDNITVQCRIEDSTRDLIRIGLVKDALDRLGNKNTKLTLPYVPQARADRVFSKGMPLPIKVFCGILNSFNFKSVTIFDPHSDVTSALINNVVVIKQEELLANKLPEIKKYMKDFILCAPDLGATKKIFDCVQLLGHEDYVQAIKIRDVTTGNIVKCDVIGDNFVGKDILIVDDLSDAAGSFIHLAKLLKLRGAGRVGLYITHGIFSKGLKPLEKDIDFIFCNGIVGNYINNEDIWRFNGR